MKTKIISYTRPNDIGAETMTELVAYVARVSNPANQHNNKTAKGLVKYLIEHKHWSPLEMVNICIEINTTRDIARQILRHRSFSYQEFSQRYAEVDNAYLFNLREARLQDTENRQNSIENDDRKMQAEWEIKQMEVASKAEAVYKWALNRGIAKEVARAVLPEGLTQTTMYMNGSLRSWLHYIDVRTHSSTQKEHREVAESIKDKISSLYDTNED